MSSVATATIGGGLVLNALLPKPDNSAGNAAANASNIQAGISKDQWDYYKQNFQPVESNLIDQANKAGSPEEYAAAAGRANADVTGGFNKGEKSSEQHMQAMGINPGSPAYASGVASAGLAEGAANAGAQTNAYNQQKQLAYSKTLDVAGLGRNIPAQSAASAAGAAQSSGVAQNSLNSQFLQNNQNMSNAGYALQPLIGAAKSYFTPANQTQQQANTYNNNMNPSLSGNEYSSLENPVGVKDGGYIKEDGVRRYAEGGNVTEENDNTLDMKQGSDGKYSAVGIEPNLIKKGFHPAMAKMANTGAITPHMRRPMNNMKRGYASGGGVGTEGLAESPNLIPSQSNQVLNGPGTETSDSIPAHVDGKTPAALSKGEFVMSAEVPKLTGEEILQAINSAGLQKRDQQGSADVSPNAGMTAYADGGNIQPQQAPVGSGMAKITMDKISAKKKYDQENIEAQTNGQSMPSFDEWLNTKSQNGYAVGGTVSQYGLN